ncbi:VOC family protein [Nocardioides litoris]|uniref:VOC family protein n=1 Tax=Nocardioides litoris TaxID=1926648 RepID=UPI001B86AAC4|nr:VOC family protein [Nocardioides litoris]
MTAPEVDRRLDGHDVEAAGLPDWRIMFYRLHARFETADLAAGARLVQAVADLADGTAHRPEVDLAHDRVDVRLHSPDVGGVTRRDVELAREVSAAAERLGATARPERVSVLELAIDTPDWDEVRAFWQAVLDFEPDPFYDGTGGEVRDPDGTMPTIWPQATDPHEPPRQRWHLDLRVPPEVAEDRVCRAIAAGGTLVSDARAPAFWVLADAQGNRACITTWRGRD